ncbi:hypothetical protein [Legionella impletisoli]|uniref:Uncharacterized protein n=1 Tax=Legionella impletisoli TaxID=343510 RepID=A0A917N9T4_9GAMM|nr:hypothetical protein [Legionella impletisoli]GGI75954.1 hypothetical protein GCM10007966_01060 [Legionella impletisoli]
MAKIKVHVLNFHSIWSHIEIVLENTSTEPHQYYGINRWELPATYWSNLGPKSYIDFASSVYSFDIEANPNEILRNWITYWNSTKDEASILGKNCAVAAQWFLTEFAGIPKPNLSNVSWNHLALGVIWPSFIPCPIMLPGRVMSNAKFYIEAKTNSDAAAKYSRLFLYTSMALATLLFTSSILGLIAAATILSGGLAAVAIVGCSLLGVASTYGFFKANTILSAKNISDEMKKTEVETPLSLPEEGVGLLATV